MYYYKIMDEDNDADSESEAIPPARPPKPILKHLDSIRPTPIKIIKPNKRVRFAFNSPIRPPTPITPSETPLTPELTPALAASNLEVGCSMSFNVRMSAPQLPSLPSATSPLLTMFEALKLTRSVAVVPPEMFVPPKPSLNEELVAERNRMSMLRRFKRS